MTPEEQGRRPGYDLRTGKPVVIIAEVRDLPLFAGLENRELTVAEMQAGARRLAAVCQLHGIMADRLGRSLMRLGRRLVAEHRARQGTGA